MELIDKNSCTGCSACYNICPVKCITMKEDAEGFLYPEINSELCVECGKCMSVCPVELSHFTAVSSYPPVYLARGGTKELRLKGASGSAFTMIAMRFIDHYKGVVFGASFDEQYNVVHTYTEKSDDVFIFSKSKYVQSDVGKSFSDVKNFLDKGRYVLFSGTPCQIYGLKSYLQHEYEKLFCIDLVCHGVPSPKVFRKYLLWHEQQHGKIESITVRDKKLFHGYYRSGFGVKFQNGRRYFRTSDKDLMGKIFWGEIASRPSCYNCKFKSIWRISDLTLGDCWFSEELAKVQDKDGITLSIIQSEKGQKLILETEGLEMFSVNPEAAVKANGGMIYSSATPNRWREEFFKELDFIDLPVLANKYIKENKKIRTKIISLLKDLGFIPKKYIQSKKNRQFNERLKRTVPDNAKGLIFLRRR